MLLIVKIALIVVICFIIYEIIKMFFKEKIEIKELKKPKKAGYKSYCEFCKKEKVFPDYFYCKYCNKYFCIEHRLPENHNYKGEPKVPEDLRKKIPWYS